MIQSTMIDTPDGKMEVMLGIPEGTGPFPALVVAHHRDGLDKFTRHVLTRLASNGFVGAAPNFYHRLPADTVVRDHVAGLLDDQLVIDVKATADHLKTLSNVSPNSLGIIGHCMGGRVAFLGAATYPFKASVMLYGGGVPQPGAGNAAPALTRAAGINCPVLGFSGRDDQRPSPEDMATISAELKRLGKQHDFHVYDGAAHAFQNIYDPRYREHASEDAWRRLLPFLREHL